MRFIFFVQGEGRGHMTQAIALSKILRENGHEVIKVLVGKSPRREIPGFFYEKIQAPVTSYESPNFSTDGKNKGVRILPTIFNNLWKIRRFLKVAKELKSLLLTEKPDAVINFYELMAGMVYRLYNPKIPLYCIGHQYLLLHPDFVFPKGHFLDRILLNANTRFTASGAKLLLGLSFVDMPNSPKKKLFVVPPLLRPEVLAMTAKEGNYLHGYLLNSGYAGEVIQWHEENPETELHFFWDNKTASEVTEVKPGLTFHKINDQKFLTYMQSCKGFASTAGFESICEAMYLNKPVLMVPTGGHFEQACNALDATRAGAGISSNSFNLTLLKEYIPEHRLNHNQYKQWVQEAQNLFITHLTSNPD
jgi:uncharacterized protein (TIGR00661 family)